MGDCREMDPGRLEKSLPSWAHLLPVALNLRASLLAPITLGSGATRSCELHFLSSMLSKVLVAQMVGICLQCRRASFDPWIRKIPGGEMATHSSILAWRIPLAEEPGRLQSIGLKEL